MIDKKQFTYQSRLIYENILSESLRRCIKERVDSPDVNYPRAVKAFSMAMPSKIKKEIKAWDNKTESKKQRDINDELLEHILLRMEKYGLLIPEQTVTRGGGYR